MTAFSAAKAAAFTKAYHPNTRMDDYRTPRYILDYIEETFGQINRDGACHETNKTGDPIDLFSGELMKMGEVLFVNPPWSTPEVKRFVEAASRQVDAGATVVFLLPNKLCEVSWVNDVIGYFDNIILLGGRVDFAGPFSVKKGATRFGTFIGVMGKGRENNPIVEGVTLRHLKEIYL